ncbi:1,4-alpha-glucan branching protein GlgB [bacterium]|nr:1,4-alpha-glucan branching protein GlgB [bacterium]
MNPRTEFLSDFDLHLIGESNHYRLWEKLGAHLVEVDGRRGVRFAVWAPNAERVAVVGDFNGWDASAHPLERRGDSGIWEGFVPDVAAGALYKYAISAHDGRYQVQKTDPFGFACELRPQTASVVTDLAGHTWQDDRWMQERGQRQALDAPMSIYEVHLASWRRVPEEGDRWLSYRELADELVAYVQEMGFTHVELMPVSEHPLDASWGYQTVGYFAPTSRFGSPQDFMHLVDRLHQAGIGVILDWVPAHFPRDEHGLGYFDGTHLFEHADPRQGEQKDWGTFVFNYGRTQVVNFLLANALYWLEVYHIDGLRVDAVASMLYLDYSRREGEWVANEHGGRENLEAIAFLKRFNEVVYREHPDVVTIAEESTAWPGVSRPTYLGGLGFGMKWNMGWMHDTLRYFAEDCIHRKYHHDKLTFSLLYAFQENFLLPLSHDEVVHGKGSLIGRMPGDEWQRFANLRTLFGFMYTHSGKQLLFMGGEFGQWAEWSEARSLDWHLLDHESHRGLQRWVRDLNTLMRGEPAMHELDCEAEGFQWIDCNDAEQSVLSYVRRSRDDRRVVVCVCNLTPVPHHNYRLGVPRDERWEEILNSDATLYGGSGQGNLGGTEATPVPAHGHDHSLIVTLPPLSVVAFRPSSLG